jgi:hypothetical protein
VLNDSNQMTKSNGGKDISSGPFIEATVEQCDATKCTVVETMNNGNPGRTFTNTGASIAFMFKREPVPASDLPAVAVSPAVSPAVVPAANQDAANQDADNQDAANQDAANQYDANQDADAVQDASEEGGRGGAGKGGSAPLPSPSPPPNPSPPKPLDPGVSCGATLPLDDLPDSCSSDAPPPPLKAYILSILSPILEEYADALFQTLRVKPLQLAESVVSDAVIAQAISPEVLERMKALNDPAVQQVLDDFKANVRKAVQQSGEMLQNGVGDNIGKLLGNAVRVFVQSTRDVIADVPFVGDLLALSGGLSGVFDAVKQAKVIESEVEKALDPVRKVQAQVGKVTAAVDEATGLASSTTVNGAEGDVELTDLTNAGESAESGEAESGKAESPSAAAESAPSPSAAPTLSTTEKGADGNIELSELGPNAESGKAASEPSAASQNTASPSAATQNTASPSAASPSAASPSAASPSAPALGNRKTPARQVGPQHTIFATPLLSENEEENDARENSRLGGGGSRKRRRIHKLSRRIERTLRRVQKKYGLQSNQSNQGNQGNQSNQDKNGFLRRTLRHRKP